MAIVCFDTHVLIWGIKQQALASQMDMIERARFLIQQCEEKQDKVIVPAIVVGEILCNLSIGQHRAIHKVLAETFVITPYDGQAALQNARIWQEQEAIRAELRAQQVNRQEVKVDIQILAVALANSCETLYTEDKNLTRLAERYIRVKKISEVQLPAHQPKLLKD